MENKNKRPRATGNFDERLTPGELLLIWRRRTGWNQLEAAQYYKVSIFHYKLAEYDKAKDFPYNKKIQITLRPYEKCLLYRKRSKKSQSEIASLLNIGRYWLRLQETGKIPCTKLLEFWENSVS